MEELISKYECRLGVMRDVEAPREVVARKEMEDE